MIIAITATEATSEADLDPRFGRCRYFILKNTETGQVDALKNEGMDFGSGAGVQAAQMIAKSNADALITGHVGPKAFDVLETAEIKVYTKEGGSVQEAIDAFMAGTLARPVREATVTSHHGSALSQSNGNGVKRVAVSAEQDTGLDAIAAQHFGRCPFYVLVDLKDRVVQNVASVANPFYDMHQPGQVPAFIQSQNANVMISGGMGARAVQFFNEYGIEVVTGAQGKISDVIQAYLSGNITGVEPCSHGHDHGDGCQS